MDASESVEPFWLGVSIFNPTNRKKLFNRAETLDFFNLYEVFLKLEAFLFLQYFITYGEFRIADKVL